MKRTKVVLLVLSILLCSGIAFADTINVPGDQPTIQAGIDASFDGDIVLVQPGTYVGNINFNGKAITLESLFYTNQDTTYISQTIIDGNQNGSVVIFENEENFNSVLSGFTITNGLANGDYPDNCGGGIYCNNNSSPSLENVTITGNSASGEFGRGGGIYCVYSSPSLMNSILWNNSPEEIYFNGDSDPNSITIAYSDIQGGEAGIVTNNNGTVNWLEGNINEDPLFVGTGGYPYSLLEESPCIDAGNPDPVYYDPEDPGNPGYALYPAMGTTINDMGTYGGPNANGWPPVGIEDNEIVQTPEVFLQQNYPNPFNPTTTISFSIHVDSKVGLTIYNIKGQKVKQLVSDQLSAGEHSVVWDGKADNDKSVSSGIYFYKMIVNGKTEAAKKCILMK